MHVGMRVIRDEHRALAAVVDALVGVLELVETGKAKADFPLMEAFIAYIEGFPLRQHHPKEDAVLFPVVAARSTELATVIAVLRRQHEEDHRKVDALKVQLAAWKADPNKRGPFAMAAREYARFTRDHIDIEESRIMKSLTTLLTDEDWVNVDAAFGSNTDPLIDRGVSSEFDQLFQVITMRAPSPIGLG